MRRKINVRFLLTVTMMSHLLISRVSADILGDFDDTINVPGFLHIDQKSESQVSTPIVKFSEHDDGVDRRMPSDILKSYLTEKLTFKVSEAEFFISQAEGYRQQAFLTYCSTKLSDKLSEDHRYCHEINWETDSSEEHKKIIKKWKKQEGYLAATMAIKSMEKAIDLARGVVFSRINSEESQVFIQHFFAAIESWESIKAEDPVWGRATSQTKYFALIGKSFLDSHKITSDRPEAANLPVPDHMKSYYPDQVYFSPEQVDRLEREGTDTSGINPPDSGFWRKPDWLYSEYEPKTYHHLGVNSLKVRHTEEQVQALLNPDQEISVVFTPSSSSKGQTPKIKVIFGDDQKWKVKFLTDKVGGHSPLNPVTAVERLMISSEVNIEPAVNNLAAILGFTVDPTYYKKVIRVYMPEEVYEKDNFDEYLETEVVSVLNKRFRASWNVRSAFDHVKTDKDGKKYIEMRGVTLEKKSDVKTDRNLSLFVRTLMGRDYKREFRAFALFLALIQDPDIKDDNTKVKMIPVKNDQGEDSFRLAYSNSDMGIALGFGFPNLYQKDFVENVSFHQDGRLKTLGLNYKALFPMPALKTVSFSDARWLMRMIAQVPESKLTEIFSYAGYPDLVAMYYKDIFLRRCDQLYKALGMVGKSYPGNDGKPFTVTLKSKMDDPDQYAVPGYEHMFNEGKLNDPKQTLFNPDREFYPRDWGMAFSPDTDGRHKDEFYKLLTKGLLLQGGNLVQKAMLDSFQFSNVMFDGGSVNPFCKNRCFFAGHKFGVDWFLPMRFVIENPTSDAKDKPYWVIDMFRLAFSLGVGSDTVLGTLGFTMGPDIIGLGADFIFGSDFIKIRPVDDYAEATKLLQNQGATRRYFFKNINEQIIEDMEKGDILIGSSYVGSRASMMLQGDANILINAGLEAGAETYLTNRIYMMKGHDQKFLVNWADVKSLNVFAAAFMQLLFIRVPVLKAEYKLSSERNRVFRFDLNDPGSRSVLFENINRTNPDRVDLAYRSKSKFVRERNHRFSLNLPLIRKETWDKGKSEILGKNFLTGEKVHEIAYERENNLRKLSHLEMSDRNHWEVKAQLDEKGDLFAKIDLRYFVNQGYRDDFVKLIDRNQAFMPADFLLFDHHDSKYYQGEMELKTMVVISPDGLDELFGAYGPSDSDLCESYVKRHRSKDPKAWCRKVFNQSRFKLSHEKNHVRKLLSRFKETRQLYRALKPELAAAVDDGDLLERPEFKKRAWELLKGIVRVLYKNRKQHQVFEALVPFIKKENFYRNTQLDSFMEGFPGLIQTIETSKKSSGSLKLLKRYMVSEVDDVFSIFTDEIDAALKQEGLLNRSSMPY